MLHRKKNILIIIFPSKVFFCNRFPVKTSFFLFVMNSGVVLIQIVLESASESVLKASKKENE